MLSPIQFIVSWAHRRRVLVMCGSLVLVLLSGLGLSRLSFDADVLSLLPRDGDATPAFRTFLQRFGSLDQLFVVFTAPEGRTVPDYADDVDRWIAELRAVPEIEWVDPGTAGPDRDWAWLAEHQLLLLRGASLDTALARLQPDGMAGALASTRELLTMPSPAVAAMVRQDPLDLLGLLRQQLGGQRAGITAGITEGGYVSADGRRRLVIAKPRRPPFDTGFSHLLMQRLDAIAAAQRSAARPDDDEPAPPVEVAFAGGHRIAIETEAVVRREAILNGVGSLALILPLLYLVFRSVWLLVCGALPSLMSLVVALGLMGLGGATLSAAATGAVGHALRPGDRRRGPRLRRASARAGGRARRHGIGRDARRAVGQHAPWHADHGRDVLWARVRRFPEPAAARAGDRPQHGGVRRADARPRSGAPAGAPPARTDQGVDVAVARVLDRETSNAACSPSPPSRRSGSARPRSGFTWTRRSSACDRPRRAPCTRSRCGRCSDCRAMSTCGSSTGRTLEPLLQANEAMVARVRDEAPQLTIDAASALLPSELAQKQLDGARRRSGAAAGGDAGEPGARCVGRGIPGRHARSLSSASPETSRPWPAAHLRRISRARPGRSHRAVRLARTGWLDARDVRVSLERRPRRARSNGSPRQSRNTGRLTGLALVNRELAARFVPQFLRGLAIGSLVVVLMIAAHVSDVAVVAAGHRADRGRPDLGGGAAGARAGSSGSLRALRRRDVCRHRDRLRHSRRAPVSRPRQTPSSPWRSSRRSSSSPG